MANHETRKDLPDRMSSQDDPVEAIENKLQRLGLPTESVSELVNADGLQDTSTTQIDSEIRPPTAEEQALFDRLFNGGEDLTPNEDRRINALIKQKVAFTTPNLFEDDTK